MSTGGPTQTQTAGLPEYIQPYVSNLLQGAQQNFYAPYTAYQGPRIAEQSPTYMWGAQQLTNNNPSPYLDMAGVATAGTIDRLNTAMDQPTWSDTAGAVPNAQWGGPDATATPWGGGAAQTQTWNGGAAASSPWTGGAATASSWQGPDAPGYAPWTGDPATAGAWQGGNWEGRSFTEPGIASLYMNPYFEGPMNIQLREAALDEGRTREALRATQASRGAFGGSRSAILESEAARNANQRESDIVANATNTAYNTGRDQFNTEEGRSLQGWQANTGQFNTDANRALQAWGMNTGQYNADANRALQSWLAQTGQFNTDANRGMEAWRMNTGQFNTDAARNLQAWGLNTGQFNTDAARALQTWGMNTGQHNTDASRALQAWGLNTGQFNTDANRAMDAWRTGANQYNAEQNQLGQLAGTQVGLSSLLRGVAGDDFTQNRQIIQDVMNVGLTEEGRRQRELDLDYQDFLDQRNYPSQQLDQYRALIYGSPYTQGSSATNQAPPNWLTQTAGLGALLWGGTGTGTKP